MSPSVRSVGGALMLALGLVSGCADTDPPAPDLRERAPALSGASEQLWVANTAGVERALRAAGAEILGRRGPDTLAVIAPASGLPPGLVAHRPTAREKTGAVLLDALDADPNALHSAEALMSVTEEMDAEVLIAASGAKIAEGGLRYGGAVWVEGDREALLALASHPRVRAVLVRLFEPSHFNGDSRLTSRVDGLHPGGETGFELTGRGITLGLVDNGPIRESHRDFGGRVSYRDTGENLAAHATHVAGTMIGAGLVRDEARGMAHESRLIGYSFFGDAVGKMAGNGHLFTASNHSYGQNLGWFNNNGNWNFRGITGFGKYDQNAERSDRVVYESDALWLKAAGNDRGDRPGQATEDRPIDCHRGYDCIASGSLAKNLIIVGAVHDLPGGPEAVSEMRETGFSGFGPSDDGRIKPDLVANGQDLTSTGSGGDEAYATFSGTSMATPTVTGIAALLLELYARHYNGATPTAAEAKAILIQTARSSYGEGRPDHRFGFGLVDAREAAQLIEDSNATPNLLMRDVVGLGVKTFEVEGVPGEDLVLTLVWTDPPGAANTAGHDDRTPVLVNDVDLALFPPGEDAGPRFPWRLQPENPGAEALRDGPNRRDNVEKIFVPAEQVVAGTWRVEVRMDVEPFGERPQAFVLASTQPLQPVDGSPVLLDVGRNVRLSLVESAEPVEVVLPIGSRDGRAVGFEIDIDALPAWLSLDRTSGTVPAEPVTATINPEGLSNAIYQARMTVRNTTEVGVPPRLLTVELQVTESEIPQALAGDDKIVPSGALVRLVGSGADPGGDPLTFEWRQAEGPEVELIDGGGARTRFTAPDNTGEDPLVLVFELLASDGENTSQPDPIRVTVLPVPVDVAGEPENNRCAGAPEVSLPYTTDGDLEVQHDVDFVAVTLVEGERIEIETFQRDEAIDTTVGVVLPNGEVLATDDDSGPDRFSQLRFTAETAGIHCVAVSTFSDFVFDGAAARTGGGYGLTILTEGVNEAPTADAGLDQVVTSGRIVRLDGRQSRDPNRDALSFEWRQLSGIELELESAGASVATFVAPGVESASVVRFRLTVGDGEFTDDAEVSVTIEPGTVVGAQPFAGPDRTVAEGARVQLDGEVEGAGGPVQWRWTQVDGPEVEIRDFGAQSTEFAAPLVDEPTELTFTVRVLEGEFLSVEDAITITVVPTEGQGEPENNNCRTAPFVDDFDVTIDDRLDTAHDVDFIRLFIRDGQTFLGETRPVGGAFTDTTIGLARLREGDVWDLRLADDDGGTFVMSRISGFFGGDGTICVAVSGHGDLDFFDGSFHEEVGGYQLRWVLGPPPGNNPPVVSLPERVVAEPGQTVTLDGSEASDPDGDPLRFEWRQIAGPDVAPEVLDTDSIDIALPIELNEETVFRFVLRVSDGFSSAEATTDLIARANNVPQLGPVEPINATEKDTVVFTLSATDPDGDPLVYGMIDGPESAVLDPETGAFEWVTALGDGGERAFVVFAEDPFGARAFQNVEITLAEGENLPPVVTAIEPRLIDAVGAQTPVVFSVEATDPESLPLTIVWRSQEGVVLGEGASIEASLASGRHDVSAEVSDGVNTVSTLVLVLVLSDAERPVAALGPSQQVAMPADTETPAAYIDGRESFDPLNRELDFVWEPGTGAENVEVTAHDAIVSIGELRFTELSDTSRRVAVRLTVVAVDEDFGPIASRPAETIIRAAPGGNRLPTASIVGPDGAAQGDTIDLDGTGSIDPDGAALSFSWGLSRGEGAFTDLAAPKAQVALGAPKDPTPIGWTVALIVSDGFANSAPELLTIRRAAAMPMNPDAGNPDAGSPDAGNEDEGLSPIDTQTPNDDCGCAVPSRPTGSGGGLLFLLVGVAVFWRRPGMNAAVKRLSPTRGSKSR